MAFESLLFFVVFKAGLSREAGEVQCYVSNKEKVVEFAFNST